MIGPVPLAVTTNLSINFLRKPAPRDLTAEAPLLKLGKRFAIGEVAIRWRGVTKSWWRMWTATYSIHPRAATEICDGIIEPK